MPLCRGVYDRQRLSSGLFQPAAESRRLGGGSSLARRTTPRPGLSPDERLYRIRFPSSLPVGRLVPRRIGWDGEELTRWSFSPVPLCTVCACVQPWQPARLVHTLGSTVDGFSGFMGGFISMTDCASCSPASFPLPSRPLRRRAFSAAITPCAGWSVSMDLWVSRSHSRPDGLVAHFERIARFPVPSLCLPIPSRLPPFHRERAHHPEGLLAEGQASCPQAPSTAWPQPTGAAFSKSGLP